jgi:ABC-type polysaccharide/polyol phosphate export permease
VTNLTTYIKNFVKYKDLLFELVLRDLKVKYRRSFLGFLWSLLNPLLMMAVLTVVFSNIFRFDIPNFPIYLLTGSIIFSFFSEATTVAMGSVIGSGSLIKKVYIPKYIFPTARVISAFVNLSFSLVAILIMIIITHVKVTFVTLMFPIPLIYVFVFSLGVGLILSSVSVFFRDMTHLYGILLTALSYFTPIFYPISIIPKEFRGIVYCNPLYYYVECFRQVVLYGKVPSVQLQMTCISIGIVTLILGMFVFYKNQDKFILYI